LFRLKVTEATWRVNFLYLFSMKSIITQFYDAFDRLDGEAMARCYHEKVVFTDPAFGELRGEHAGNMWKMLCESQKGKDFTVATSKIQGDENGGSAYWEAIYLFSATGRKVHNKIYAEFSFKDGKIINHNDLFDLKEWAVQALGFKGTLIGGTKFFSKKLNQQTRGLLTKWEQKNA